jgi:carbonic anhydrase/acetyltransferase-like protein (isoleucine patch superfamily)
MSVSGQDIGE